jgi:hypothetical protein
MKALNVAPFSRKLGIPVKTVKRFVNCAALGQRGKMADAHKNRIKIGPRTAHYPRHVPFSPIVETAAMTFTPFAKDILLLAAALIAVIGIGCIMTTVFHLRN